MLIIDVIRTLLPCGTAHGLILKQIESGGFFSTVAGAGTSWEACPVWPPDVFAVAATLIEKSNCCMLAGPSRQNRAQHEDELKKVFADADTWVTGYTIPRPVQTRWSQLLSFGDRELSFIKESRELRTVLFGLLATADEASNGLGWAPAEASRASVDDGSPNPPNMLVKLVMTSLLDTDELRKTARDAYVLPFARVSLCSLVFQDVAVVLPKSMTANVGCTIRSLSHHLALLPSSLQVRPKWQLVDKASGRSIHSPVMLAGGNRESDYGAPVRRRPKVRLLIVPFPFHIPENSFRLRENAEEIAGRASTSAFFELKQRWLENGHPDGEEMADSLLRPLLEKARKESGCDDIHGIVMPECALSRELADDLARQLRNDGIDFFITGVLDRATSTTTATSTSPSEQIPGLLHNRASTYLFPKRPGKNTEVSTVMSSQSKHHRWSLDQFQADRYALNFPQESEEKDKRTRKQWWEAIDISERDLPFYAIRQGVSMAVLICEDLARTDPAMTIIRAVGPNLVVALLMDGPQLATRWPARYATVLADDPGSSVLTLTCAALVDRANWMESRPVRSIALWRDARGGMKELNLPAGHHGMCLTLTADYVPQFTMDGRSDVSATQELELTAAIPLALETKKIPEWL